MTAPRLLTPNQIIIKSGTYIVIESIEGATLTCGSQSYMLGGGETMHAFEVDAGTYACTANLTGYYEASTSITILTGFEYVTLLPTYLPTAYQQAEYLRSNGSQYIITNVTNNTDQIINCKFLFEVNRSQRIFGTTSESQFIYAVGDAVNYVAQNNSENVLYTSAAFMRYNNIYDVTLYNNTSININGVDYANAITYGGATTQSAYYVFKRPGDSGNICLIGRVYKFNVTQSGSKIIDLVPCYRKSDSVAGMYDKVTDTFLTNSGTGSFTVGADVS